MSDYEETGYTDADFYTPDEEEVEDCHHLILEQKGDKHYCVECHQEMSNKGYIKELPDFSHPGEEE